MIFAEITASDIPKWMLYFSFIASLVLTFLKILAVVKRPSLAINLTPDLFFRISDLGECLFCNPIYLAWNGPILVLNSTAKLERLGEKTKLCPFKIIQFGEKVKGTSLTPEFYFHSSSPIQHVDEGKPQRVLYLLAESSKHDELKQHFTQFITYSSQLKTESRKRLPQDENDPEARQAFVDWLIGQRDEAVRETVTKIMDCVQIEGGDYKFTVKIEYTNPKNSFLKPYHKFARWLIVRSTSASLKFAMNENVREQIRTQLNATFQTVISNIVADKKDVVAWPEYVPLKISVS